MENRMKNIVNLSLSLSVILFVSSFAFAQESVLDIPQTQNVSIWSTIADGGIIGYSIICMSLCASALIVEHFLTLRASVLMPVENIDALAELVAKGDYKGALNECDRYDCFILRIMRNGLKFCGDGFIVADVEKAIEESARRESGRLFRKLEYLSFIAASAPMLGLLGTVTGMISAFNHIAAVDGTARSSQLASAISQALVTTCLGLLVAIPTLFFLSLFRNRIESIMTEAELAVESIIHPLKLNNKNFSNPSSLQ